MTSTQTQLDLEPRSAKKCLTRKRVLCTLQEVYSLCTLPVAFSELRLTGRENASDFSKKKNNNLDGGQILWFLSRIFLKFSATSNFKNCFIDHLWSDHSSPCQLCCCHPFHFEDYESVLHQDAEDH